MKLNYRVPFMKIFLKYLLAAGVFLGVLLISEATYMVKNRPEFTQTFYLLLAKREASSNNIQQSLKLLAKSARGNIDMTAKKYPDYIQKNYPEVSYDANNEGFREEYMKYLESVPSFILIQDKTHRFTRIFYDLGLLAYKTSEKELVIYFWQQAIFLDPQMSRYHVELANFYLREGDEERAKKVLEFCSNFKYPNEHCRQYQDNNLFRETPEEVGFLKE